ncbi:MAG: long-chain fatty acid--CoA ligase [Gammaproteobacteria bacterium]|nr:long-chain fatty acid--CoA ligase [Gammaproteobacteria bacterium]
MMIQQDYITPNDAKNLSGLFYERVKRSGDKIAYSYFDPVDDKWIKLSWNDISKKVEMWHSAFRHEGLKQGDRVAIMMKNSPDWVIFDQAAYSLGLVVVPIYTNDRPENIRYILDNASVKIFFIEDPSYCKELMSNNNHFDYLVRIVTNEPVDKYNNSLLMSVKDWLPSYAETINRVVPEPDALATIVYTSGTTGRPKGVMLSHNNILLNAYAGATFENFDSNDIFLSFLPLSHMFERTAGYYMPMVIGAKVTYARSIEKLAEDLITIAPTILVTVPRIFERVYNKIYEQLEQKPAIAKKLFSLAVETGWHRFLLQQHRIKWHPKLLLWPVLNKLVASKILKKLGGNIRLAISGGAALSPEIAKTFIGLGLTITQGYGLTETSPIISTNKLNNNDPFSVGQTMDGVEIKLGENNELLVKGPMVMMGYWDNKEATNEVIDQDGWFHTGDKVKIEHEHIYITGRIKDIIVLSNGEKVSPNDVELAISSDPVFEQVVVIGEAKPYLTALITMESNKWKELAGSMSVSPNEESLKSDNVMAILINRINKRLSEFPGYAKIIRVHIVLQPWTIEDGLVTPTLKLKRSKIYEKYSNEINKLYEGH